MVLPVVKYGHPALRQKGAPLGELTPQIREFIHDLIETMYAANGIGLAAQQVGRALQLTVIDVAPVTDRPSTLEIGGQPAKLKDWMPLVLINPSITPLGAPATGPEGCLSFPDIYADITRPESVAVTATNPQGRQFSFRAGGLLARAVQHEVDHLNGILFIDRMDRETRDHLRPELEQMLARTKSELRARVG